jgi:hypothetical protein
LRIEVSCVDHFALELLATRTSIQVKLDMGIFFPLSAVVVRSPLHHLDILELEARAGRLRDEQYAESDCSCDCECGRCEEAEDALHAHQS